MFKTTVLLLSFLMATAVQAQISKGSVSGYLSQLRSLSDNDLVNYMEKRGSFGTCKFSSMRFLPAASFKYKIVAPFNEVIAISPAAKLQGLSPVIGLVKPTNIASTISARSHFDTVRANVVNLSLPDSIAASLIRDRFLKSSNPCGINNNHIPGVGSVSVGSVDPADVTFYKDLTTKAASRLASNAIRCKTKILSASIFNSSSCSYEQKEKVLPTSLCSTLYNRFKKANIPNVEVKQWTQAIAGQFATLALASANTLAAEVASTKTDLIAAIPVKQLAQIEYLDSVASCSTIGGCISSDLQSLAATIKYSSDNNYAVEPSIKSLASSASVLSAQAVPLNASVHASKLALATSLDAKASTLSLSYGATATAIPSFSVKIASPCALQFQAVSVAAPMSAF